MESIWTNTASVPSFPALEGDIRTDVLVIGGGMAGLLCAHRLQKAGVSCMVAEADTIAGGVTKNTTAKITAQHGFVYSQLIRKFGPEKARQYYEANRLALEEYARLCQGIDCDFTRRDNFIYSREDMDALEEELAAMGTLGIPGVFSHTPELPFPTVGAVMLPEQAQFHPLKFLRFLAKDLTIYEHTPSGSWKNAQPSQIGVPSGQIPFWLPPISPFGTGTEATFSSSISSAPTLCPWKTPPSRRECTWTRKKTVFPFGAMAAV